MGSPVRGASGYPGAAATTHTAAASTNRGRVTSLPAATSASRAARSPSKRGRTTWVSGSPKRTLNSSTFGPVAVSMSPA